MSAKVLPSQFQPSLSSGEATKIANEMAVDPYDFARISCLDGRIYGVLTADTYDDDNVFEDWTLNSCARQHLWSLLHTYGSQLERHLGYPLSKRYVSDEIKIEAGQRKVLLSFPAVKKINVDQSYKVAESHDANYPVNFYLATGLSVTDNKVTVSREYVENPDRVYAWYDSGEQVQIAYSDVQLVGEDWVIPLKDYSGAGTVSLQSREYVTVTVPDADYSFILTYPDSDQEIPLLDTPKVSGENLVFKIPVYVLVRPEFVRQKSRWYAGHFHRFFSQVGVKKVEETAIVAELSTMVDGVTYSYPITVGVISSQYGVVGLDYDTDENPYRLLLKEESVSSVPDHITWYLNISYLVDPSVLPPRFVSQIEGAKRAIVHKVAAQMPMKSCRCHIDFGFIAENQQVYGEIYSTPGGTIVEKYRYGQQLGAVEYVKYKESCVILKRPVIL